MSFFDNHFADDQFLPSKQRMWTVDEDTQLVSLVERIGVQKWSQIAEYLPGRQGKHCRERWHNHLNPRNKKSDWSKKEEWVLFLLQRRMKNKWARYADVLEGRTDNTIKNHWNCTMKSKIKHLAEKLNEYLDKMVQVQVKKGKISEDKSTKI